MSVLLDDESSQYLIRTATLPVSAVPFSFSAWIYPDEETSSVAVSIGGAATAFYHALYLFWDPNNLTSKARTYDGNVQDAWNTDDFAINQWINLVGVWPTVGERRIYVNGGGKVINSVTQDAIVMDRFTLGVTGDGSSPVFYCSGRLAEVGVWSGALGDAHAASLGNKDAPSIVDVGNLVAYYPLIDDPNDAKGSFHLTEVNSPTYTTHVPGMNYGGEPAAGNPVVKIMLQMNQFNGGTLK